MKSFLDLLLFRDFRLNKISKNFFDCVQREAADEFLELLLKMMSLAFVVDRNYRRNIENFQGKYLFSSKDGAVNVSVIFKDEKMKVGEDKIDNPDVAILFKDYKAMMEFLLAREQDILDAVLHQKVTYDGNLNYLSKFVYMAKNLQLSMSGAI